MHYLSLVYFVDQPLHVSGIFVAYHLGYTVYIQQLVRVVLFSLLSVGRPSASQLKSTTRTNFCIYVKLKD